MKNNNTQKNIIQKNIINTTPHSITFQNSQGEIYTIDPCGIVINAKPVKTKDQLYKFLLLLLQQKKKQN